MISDWLLIRYYPSKKCKSANKLLVIGLLRKFFKFKLFLYKNL